MIQRAAGRITLTIEGSSVDHGHVRLSDFLEELEALKEALRQTERSVFNADPQLYYRIVDASHSSPLRMVIEAVPPKPGKKARASAKRVISAFTKSVIEIKRRRRPKNLDLPVLEAYRGLGATLGKHVEALTISDPRGKVIPIDSVFKENIVDVIGPDQFSVGSITGRLEKLNVHNTSRFEIYPTVGPHKLICTFDDSQLDVVRRAIKRYVTVTGRLRYKQWANFPHAIDTKHIDIHEMDDELPTLEDMRGIAPRATGDLSSEEFVRRMRDEDW